MASIWFTHRPDADVATVSRNGLDLTVVIFQLVFILENWRLTTLVLLKLFSNKALNKIACNVIVGQNLNLFMSTDSIIAFKKAVIIIFSHRS